MAKRPCVNVRLPDANVWIARRWARGEGEGRDKDPFGHVSTATRPPRHKFRGFNRDPWLPVSGDHKLLLAAIPRHHYLFFLLFLSDSLLVRESRVIVIGSKEIEMIEIGSKFLYRLRLKKKRVLEEFARSSDRSDELEKFRKWREMVDENNILE